MALNLEFKLQDTPKLHVSMSKPENFELDENELPRDDGSVDFFFEFKLRSKSLWVIRRLSREISIVKRRKSPTVITARFRCDPNLFKFQNLLDYNVSEMLSFLKINVGRQQNLIEPIVWFASRMVNSKDNLGKKTMLMRIELTTCFVFMYDEREVMRQALLESGEQQIQMRGTSKAAIDSLEKFRYEFDNGTDQFITSCMVCLDEFETGSEVTRLPCSHVYHGNCIEQWLEKSHYCPICRFKMPTET